MRRRQDIRPISTKPAAWVRHDYLALLATAILLAGGAVMTFGPALDGVFLNWDDDRNFVRNEAYRGLGAEQLRWAWQTYHLGVWQPVGWMLLGMQWCIGGLSPRTYHIVSLALHILNCTVLYIVMLRLFAILRGTSSQASDNTSHQPARVGCAFAVLIFALHPLRVEPVAWISCQPYLPAAFFLLLAMLLYLRASQHALATPARLIWLVGSLACFTIAVACKAVAVTFPIILIILDFLVLPDATMPDTRVSRLRRHGHRLLEKLPFFAVALPVCLWAIHAKDYADSRAPWAEFNMPERIAQSGYGLVMYLLRTIVPVGLTPYDRMPSGIHPAEWPYNACAAIVLAITIILLLLRRRQPTLLAAWLAYIIILLPNLGVIQISQQITADRYAYLATMPIMLIVAGILAAIWRRLSPASLGRVAFIGICLALLAGEVATSRAYAAAWVDSRSLWRRAIALDPNCAVAHCNLGEALLREERYADASVHLAKAIDLDPGFSFAYANFAALLVRADRPEDAVAAGLRAMDARPALTGMDLARAHAILGEAYAAMRMDDLAWKHTLKARELGFTEAEKMLDYLRRFSTPPK